MHWLRVILLPLCMLACSDRARLQSGTILPDSVQLKAGDVVFRRGSGFTSHAVLLAEGQEGVYSHTGIVVDSAGVLMIVHAVPGEPDYEGDEDRVKMERPEEFFLLTKAQQGAIYRHKDSTKALSAARQAWQTYQRHPRFDHDYDASDTTALYCTELVLYAYRQARAPLKGVKCHHLHLVGFESDCFLPSDLRKSSDLKLVVAF